MHWKRLISGWYEYSSDIRGRKGQKENIHSWSDDDPGFYHQSKTMGGFFRMEYPFGLK